MNLQPWQREVLAEIVKEYINTEVRKRAMAIQRADDSKRDPRESEARYRNRIESLRGIYNIVRGDD